MTQTVDGSPTPEMLVSTPREIARPLRGQPERLVKLGGALLLTAFGLSRGGWLGVGALVAGGVMAYSARRAPLERWKKRWVTAEATITILGSSRELYERWAAPEDLPRWISHLHRVTRESASSEHYLLEARTRESGTLQWRIRCAERVPGEHIRWQSARDADIPWTAALTFTPAPKGRGTEVRLRMTYGPPGGLLGSIAAGIMGDDEPGYSLAQDLRRFKQLVETGEVATTEGQPRGGFGHRIEQRAHKRRSIGTELGQLAQGGAA